MASSSTTPDSPKQSTSTTSEIVDVEYEAARHEFYKKVLQDNYICLPPAYYRPMVQSGLMEQFVHLILNVNEKENQFKEKLFGFKRRQE